MLAAVLTHLNAPLELMELEHAWAREDQFLAPAQVLVEIRMSGICGSQLQEIAGNKGNKDYLPHCLGHEAAATIRDVGPGVDLKLIGKKCVLHWRKGEGQEALYPARYLSGLAGVSVGGGHVTTLAERAVVSRNRLTVVPDDVPDELCALLGCGLSTALGTIEQEARLKFGESILIVGCGGVGLNLIQAARLARAYPIVAMDIVSDKQDATTKLGANVYLNAKHTNPREAMHMFGLKGFDCIVDTSGSVEALEAVVPLLADGGRLIMVGQPRPGESLKIMGALDLFHQQHGCRIQTTQGGGFRPSVDIPRYLNLWRSGHLDLDSIISHRFPLADVNRGIELVRAGQAGRVMISMR